MEKQGGSIMKKYIAYGSNLNLEQMSMRCPTAKVVGTTLLKDYQLTFRNVATIEPKVGSVVPVAVWEIDEISERALDRYEGYPRLYRKEYLDIELNGKKEKALVYIMNIGEPAYPGRGYYDVILQGYYDVGLDTAYLEDAIKDTYKRMQQNS